MDRAQRAHDVGWAAGTGEPAAPIDLSPTQQRVRVEVALPIEGSTGYDAVVEDPLHEVCIPCLAGGQQQTPVPHDAGYLGTGLNENPELSNSNIRFIHEYFTLEKIHVERSDLGGNFRRRVYFSLKDGKVYRQMLKNNEESSEFIKLEKEYIDVQFRNKKKTGRVILFE